MAHDKYENFVSFFLEREKAKTNEKANANAKDFSNKSWHFSKDISSFRFQDLIYKDKKEFKSYIFKAESKLNKNEKPKEASLDCQFLAFDNQENISLALVRLETGRHHQIRVQFSSRNMPLVFDRLYGKEIQKKSKRDIALLASHLAFLHPCRENKLIDLWHIDPEHQAFARYKDLLEALMMAVNEAKMKEEKI